MSGPLAGFRVIDLTAVVLGPYASQMLADFGADVIKVEPPEGDINRHLGPQKTPMMSPLHLGINRGKRSVCLDLKKPEARAALLKLAEGADVFMHTMRPKAARALGIDYADVKKVKPDIVYANALGYASDGPYGDKPAFDDIIQAASGVASLMAEIAGEPRYAPTIIADKGTGLAFGNAILAAMIHRQKTGQGQHVEVPMFETMVGFCMLEHLWTKTTDPESGTIGYPRVLSPNRRPYKTKDGWIGVLPYSDAHWRLTFEAIGKAGTLEDPRFNSLSARTRNIDALYGMLQEGLTTKSTAEWLEIFDRLQVPCAPVSRLADLPEHPHAKAVGLFQTMEHPTEGRMMTVRPAARFSETPAEIGIPAATLGQHTREVLAEAGLSESAIDAATKA